MQAHLVSKEEVLAKLKTDLTGLQVEEAKNSVKMSCR